MLPEDDVRDKITQDFSSQAGQYDVGTISNYETPIYAKNGWLAPLTAEAKADTAFDQSDILPAMQQSLTVPRPDLRRAVLRRVVVPDVPQGRLRREAPDHARRPDLARRSPTSRPRRTARSQGMKGICLRGQPGWGEMIAPLTTVVNTMGGTWFDQNWQAQLDQPGLHQGHQVLRRPGPASTARPARRSPASPSASTTWSRARSPCGTTPRPRPARWRAPTPRSPGRSATCPRRWTRPRARAGCTPGRGACRRRASTSPTPGSSSPGRPARATRTWSARSSAGPGCRPASAPRRTPTPRT